MDLSLWILQGIVAFIFFGTGIIKLITTEEKLVERLGKWTNNYKTSSIKLIGFAEVLASAGLIYPMLFNILPFLTIISAIGLAIIMFMAVRLHLSRKESVILPSILLIGTLSITVGRIYTMLVF